MTDDVVPGNEGGAPEELRRRLAALKRERDGLRAALAAAEDNFRSAFLATPAGMSLSRIDSGKIIDMNDAFLDILGFAREQVIGRTSGELNLWVSEDQRARLVGELRAQGRASAREERMRRRDGTIATVLFSAVPAVVGGEPHTITWVLDISGRRVAEEALRASEARWRSLVEQAPSLVLVTDPSGIVRYANRSLSGRPLGPMLGNPVFDFVPEAYREEARGVFTRAVAERAQKPFTHYLERVGGGRVWLDSLVAPVLRDGELESVMIISTDVTRRVEAEASLRATEAQWRSLVTHAPAAISQVDRDGTLLFINRSFTGRPAAEMIGRRIFDFVGEEAAAIGRAKLAEAYASGRRVQFEFSMPTVDGRVVHAQNTLAPVVIDGEVQSVISVVTDLTAQVEGRRALAESEQRFRDIVESMGDWYWEMDATGRITFSSEHCQGMLGRSPAEMLGRSPVEFAAPDDAARQRQYLAEHGSPPRPVRHFEGWYLRPDGSRVCIAVSGVPVFDGAGALAGWRGVAHDVTGRRLAEAERAAIEAKMQQAQKLESLGVLAGGIAHDFNNLLAAVLGNAELALAELPPGAAARESVAQIQRAGLHAAELTRQLLAYAGRGSIAAQRVSLAGIVRDMAQLLGSSISKRHALTLDLPASLPAVEADPAQLRQIVMNLVINASEAIGEREGVVSVRAEPLGPGKDPVADLAIGELAAVPQVLLEVTDTGEGMDAATLARIFEPFFSTKFAGRGLGLAAVLGIVRRHRGALRVRSAPGAGSTFSVLLPARGEHAPDGGSAAPTTDGAWRGAGTILLVDDEEAVRQMASRMLRALGFEVVAAADGTEALALLGERGKRVRAVLLDLTMPRMDGGATLHGIRQLAPDLPVVLCSGYDVSERQDRFAGLSFSGFLQKPFGLAELRRALRRALGE